MTYLCYILLVTQPDPGTAWEGTVFPTVLGGGDHGCYLGDWPPPAGDRVGENSLPDHKAGKEGKEGGLVGRVLGHRRF